jgi:hypothetical protein
MNDIVITKDNFPKLSRRLQKVLSKHFEKDVLLTEAHLLFAQAMGKNTVHELQQVLGKFKTTELSTKDYNSHDGLASVMLDNDQNIKSQNISSIEQRELKLSCQPFIQYVQSYFSRNKEKSEIIGFSIVHDVDSQSKDSISLKIYVKPKIEKKRFGFISCSIARFSTDLYLFLNEFDVSNQDQVFLNKMDFFLDDRTLKTQFFPIMLKKYLNIDEYHQEYSLYSQKPSDTKIFVQNFLNMKHGYMVDDDIDSNLEQIPYVFAEPNLSTKWADISILHPKNKIIDTFEKAFAKIKRNGGVLWQCCYQPLPVDVDPEQPLFICSSFYIYELEKDLYMFSSVDGEFEQKFIEEKGIAFYRGLLESLVLNKTFKNNPYYVNEKEFKQWSDGCSEGLNEKAKLIKTHIPRKDKFRKKFLKTMT